MGKDGEEVSESMVPSPTEGSVEEAVAITSSGGNFWIWVLRAMLKFLVRTLVGDMRFSALILKGRVLPYALEGSTPFNEKEDTGYFPKQPSATNSSSSDGDDEDLKVWGLTLGMTLDLLSGMQPHLYDDTLNLNHSRNNSIPSPTDPILDSSSRSFPRAGQSHSPIFENWSGARAGASSTSISSVPADRQPGTRNRAASLSVTQSTDPNAPPAPRPSTPSISTAQNGVHLSRKGSFLPGGKWAASAGPKTPGTREMVKHFEEELKDMGGLEGVRTVWTPSMTVVFPRFSIPDVNFWIW